MTPEEADQRDTDVHIMAIARVLVRKGICTLQELETAKEECRVLLDAAKVKELSTPKPTKGKKK